MSRSLTLLVAIVAATMIPPTAALAAELRCSLSYNMSGGGAFYKRSSGDGVVRCSDGSALVVKLASRGGGLTFGQSTIVDGVGKFSPISNIRDVIGGYATAEANAGSGSGASKAQVVTKGTISLALSGTGTGRTLGVSFGSFIISER